MAIKFLNTVAVDTDVLFVDTVNNQVGIGTDNPSEKLTVDAQSADGVTTTIASFHSNEGESGDTAIQLAVRRSDSLGSDRKTFLNATGAGNFEIQRSGSTKVTISGAGNVGIGTDNPKAKLHTKVGSSTTALMLENSAGGGGAYVDLDFNTYNTAQPGWANAAASIRVIDNAAFGGDITFRGKTSGIGNTQNELMRIEATGNVGIGTTGPNEKLEVNGNIKLSSTVGQTATPSSIWLGNDYSNGQTRDKLKIYLYNSGTEQYGFTVGNQSDIQYHSNQEHDFYVANSLKVRINQSGNVGIGATSPGVKLQLVSADEQLTNFSSSVADQLAYSQINANSSTAGVYTGAAALELVGKANASGHGRHAWIGAEGTPNTSTKTKLKFKVRGETATGYDWAGAAEAPTIMTLEGDGNVGVGTTSPGAKLHVQGASATEVPIVRIGGFGNSGSKLELAETLSGADMNYGFSFFNDGNSTNKLIVKAHDNSTTGLTAFSIDRSNALTTFNVNPVVGTRAAGDNSTRAASTAFVTSAISTRTPFNDIRSLGVPAFTNGTSPNITTAQVMAEIEGDGGFDSYSSVFKTSWSYAGNYNLTDAGGFTETAGSSWITWTDNSSDTTRGNITTLAIAPNTGGSAGGVFIYNDQGSTYSPGWREVWTSMTDGAGSGLDADKLDGQEGAYYYPASNPSGYTANAGTVTGSGTAGYIPKWGTTSALANSSALYNGTSGLLNINNTFSGSPTGSSSSPDLWITGSTTNSQAVIALMNATTVSTVNQVNGDIEFGTKDDGSAGYVSARIRGIQTLASGTGNAGRGELQFATNLGNTGSSPETRMVINYQGNVGIGTTNPAGKLDVNGNIRAGAGTTKGFEINTGYGVHGMKSYYGTLYFTTSLYAGGVNGIPYKSISASAFYVNSDYRLKTNVTVLEGASERVKKLNVHRFNWKDRLDEEKVDGFIAHELAEVIPEAVTGDKDAFREDGTLDPQQIDQSKIVPLLAAALKEAIEKIEQLETRIQTLENN